MAKPRGYIIVISRNGSDGNRYPLSNTECFFGRSNDCDVRIRVSNVEKRHCVITAKQNEQATICNLSGKMTLVNGTPIGSPEHYLRHGDVITVGDRFFRWEYPDSASYTSSPKSPQTNEGSSYMVKVFRAKQSADENEVTPSSPKRRKILEPDIRLENTSTRRVNKLLLGVTQPASSPKSYTTFKLLKSASRRKTLNPASGSQSADKRPKSLPPGTSLKRESTSGTDINKKLKLSPKSPNKNEDKSPKPTGMLNTQNKTTKEKSPRKSQTSFQESPQTPKEISPAASSKRESSVKQVSVLANPLIIAKTPTISPISKAPSPRSGPLRGKQSNTPLKKDTPKTPRGRSLSKSHSVKGNATLITPPSPRSSQSNSPAKTPKGRASLKLSTNKKSQSSSNDSPKTPNTLGGKQYSTAKKSASLPISSPSPRGRSSSKTRRSSRKSIIGKKPATTASTSSTPGKISLAKTPAKTPEGKARKSSIAEKLPSPSSRNSSPSKTPAMKLRERPRKSSIGKKPVTPQSPSSSPSHSTPAKTPAKTPRGRKKSSIGEKIPTSPLTSHLPRTPAKTPRSKARKYSVEKKSPAFSPLPKTSSTSKMAAKTPRGAARKSVAIRSASSSPSPRSKSPAKTAAKTPRGTARKSVAKRSASSSPSQRSGSPAKAPRGAARKSVAKRSASSSPSPRSSPPAKTPLGKERKSFTASKPLTLHSASSSPRNSSPAKTPARTPRESTENSDVNKTQTPPLSPPSPSKRSSSRVSEGRQVNSSVLEESISLRLSPSSKNNSPARTPCGKTRKSAVTECVTLESPTLHEEKKGSPLIKKGQSSSASKINNNILKRKSTRRSLQNVSSTYKSPTKRTAVLANPLMKVTESNISQSSKSSLSGKRNLSSVLADLASDTEQEAGITQVPISKGSSVKDLVKLFNSKSSLTPSANVNLLRRKSKSLTRTPSPKFSPCKTPNVNLEVSTPRSAKSIINSSAGLRSLRFSDDDDSFSNPHTPQIKSPKIQPITKSTSGKRSSVVRASLRNKSFSLEQSPSHQTPKTPKMVVPDIKVTSPSPSPISAQAASSRRSSDIKVTSASSSPSVSVSSLRRKSRSLAKTPSPVNDNSSVQFCVESTPSPSNLSKSLNNLSQTPVSGKRKRLGSKNYSSMENLSKIQTPIPNRTSILRQSLHWPMDVEEALSNLKNARRSLLPGEMSTSRRSTPKRASSAGPSTAEKTSLGKTTSEGKRIKENDFEAKAERAAKRLKMETPKSLSKNKVAALLVCHGRSPRKSEEVKRPLWSEVLKFHLSTAKKKQQTTCQSMPAAGVRRNVKAHKPFVPSLEVPKSFKFNSTGHANSPETIIITKKQKMAQEPTLNAQNNTLSHKTNVSKKVLEGNSQIALKTPGKSIVSSLKSASSVKKPQHIRVTFSLQDDIQNSPSVESKKRYIGTPRPVSRTSMVYDSIVEESPLAESINSSQLSSSSSTKRQSRRSTQSVQSYDFSAYSPSSPTLQFSKISGISSQLGTSIELDSENESPKRKRDMPLLDTPEVSSSGKRRLSYAGSSVRSSQRNSQTPVNNAPSVSYLFGSPVSDSSVLTINSKVTRKRGHSGSSEYSSGLFRYSTDSTKSSRSSSPKINETQDMLSPIKASTSIKNVSFDKGTPKEARSLPSKSSSSAESLSSPLRSSRRSKSSNSMQSFDKDLEQLNEYDGSRRVSSTPKPKVSSAKGSVINSENNSPESLNTTFNVGDTTDYSFTNSGIVFQSTQLQQSSSTPRRASRKSSVRMTASDPSMIISDNNVPVATVKPSLRKKLGHESMVSNGEFTSLPDLTIPQDNRRSIFTNLAFARSVEGFNQLETSRASTSSLSNSTSSGSQPQPSSSSSCRRKQKPHGSSNCSRTSSGTSLNISSVNIPHASKEMLVSPLSSQISSRLSEITGVKRIQPPHASSPASSYFDVRGLRRLMGTPQNATPPANYTDVQGVKALFKSGTPQNGTPPANYTDVQGIKALFENKSPVDDYTNVSGLSKLYNEKSHINFKGVRRGFKDTNSQASPSFVGLELLFESPSKPTGMVPPMARPPSEKEEKAISGEVLRDARDDSESVGSRVSQNFDENLVEDNTRPSTSKTSQNKKSKPKSQQSKNQQKVESDTVEAVSAPRVTRNTRGSRKEILVEPTAGPSTGLTSRESPPKRPRRGKEPEKSTVIENIESDSVPVNKRGRKRVMETVEEISAPDDKKSGKTRKVMKKEAQEEIQNDSRQGKKDDGPTENVTGEVRQTRRRRGLDKEKVLPKPASERKSVVVDKAESMKEVQAENQLNTRRGRRGDTVRENDKVEVRQPRTRRGSDKEEAMPVPPAKSNRKSRIVDKAEPTKEDKAAKPNRTRKSVAPVIVEEEKAQSPVKSRRRKPGKKEEKNLEVINVVSSEREADNKQTRQKKNVTSKALKKVHFKTKSSDEPPAKRGRKASTTEKNYSTEPTLEEEIPEKRVTRRGARQEKPKRHSASKISPKIPKKETSTKKKSPTLKVKTLATTAKSKATRSKHSSSSNTSTSSTEKSGKESMQFILTLTPSKSNNQMKASLTPTQPTKSISKKESEKKATTVSVKSKPKAPKLKATKKSFTPPAPSPPAQPSPPTRRVLRRKK